MGLLRRAPRVALQHAKQRSARLRGARRRAPRVLLHEWWRLHWSATKPAAWLLLLLLSLLLRLLRLWLRRRQRRSGQLLVVPRHATIEVWRQHSRRSAHSDRGSAGRCSRRRRHLLVSGRGRVAAARRAGRVLARDPHDQDLA
jgi:hypothetical protein